MRTEALRRLVTPLLALCTACASSSIKDDVRAVRARADVPVLPALPNGRSDVREADDVKELLAAPLDANAAVRVALLGNRELRARLRSLGVERGMLIQAGLPENPSLEAELSPERDSRVELRAEYDVMSLVLAPMRRKAAKHELDAARSAVASAVLQLGYEVRSAFYDLQAARQAYTYATHVLDALAAGRDAAEALFAAGNLRELDASTQIAAFERTRVVVAKLELEIAEKREALQRLLGLHGEATGWELAPTLGDAPDEQAVPDDIEARAVTANLELAATRSRLEALAKRTGITRLEGLLPRIDVDLHSLVGNPDNEARDNLRWGGGVGVDVPIFDRKQGLLRVREAEFDAELERYQGSAIAVRSRAREVRARVLSTHRRALQYQRVIAPAQDRVMQHTQLQYNAMQIGVFQLLEARRAQIDVTLEQIATLRDYWHALAEYDALVHGHMVARDGGTTSSALPRSSGGEGGH